MKLKSLCLLIFVITLAGNTHAQTCDPWIIQSYKQLYGRGPDQIECFISNYNNGSWNGYDQLKGLIRKYRGADTYSTLARRAAEGKCLNVDYYGICKIAEFTNDDFPVQGTTCGQAAAVTALWHAGLNSNYNNKPGTLLTQYYNYAPPKITIGGLIEYKDSLGTDWRQVEYGLNKYANMGIRYNWQKGKSALQNELRKGNPCLIMIDMGTLPPYNWGVGHWVVAYGYDHTYLYVTNLKNKGNKMTWSQLHKAWGGSLTEGNLAKIHGKAEMFATVWKD